MSRLDELIAELCPDGVEYKEIQELFYLKNGYTPPKSNPSNYEYGTIPWFRMEDIRENGGILSDAMQKISQSAVKGSLFPANSIIVATSATIGVHALVTVDFLCNQRFTCLSLKDVYNEKICPKFIYYMCFKLDKWCLENSNFSSFASVDMSRFRGYKIPVPPLPVQEEIVRILDKFAELTAELTKRKQQYQYYCDKLLCYDKNNNKFPTVKVGDIATFTYGYTEKAKDTGSARFIRITDITENGCLNPYDAKFVDLTKENERYLLKEGDILMARTGATYGKTLYIPNNESAIYASFLIKISLNNSKVINRFYWHFAQSTMYWQQADNLASKGGQPQFNSNVLCKVLLPLPPIEEQERIVAILDRFDALCNDLTSGLPAEIEARKKQYEYYRDKLLTFKEAV